METRRLSLRPVTDADLRDMHRLYGDPRVMRAFGPSGPWSLNQTTERVAEIVRHWERHRFGRYHLSLRESGEFVGRGGLEHDEDLGALDLGYSLLPHWWGRGLATEAGRAFIREAFTELGARARGHRHDAGQHQIDPSGRVARIRPRPRRHPRRHPVPFVHPHPGPLGPARPGRGFRLTPLPEVW